MSDFFKGFNALQITGIFAAFPFLLMFLNSATFSGHWVAFLIASIVYFIFFCVMIGCIYHAMFDK